MDAHKPLLLRSFRNTQSFNSFHCSKEEGKCLCHSCDLGSSEDRDGHAVDEIKGERKKRQSDCYCRDVGVTTVGYDRACTTTRLGNCCITKTITLYKYICEWYCPPPCWYDEIPPECEMEILPMH